MTATGSPVSSIEHLDGRIDDTTPAPTAAAGERAVPYHCPYCGEEDLRPHGATPGAWHCRSCTRAFAVRFLGLEPLEPTWAAPLTPAGNAPAPIGHPTPEGTHR
jgi:hypothetical protein